MSDTEFIKPTNTTPTHEQVKGYGTLASNSELDRQIKIEARKRFFATLNHLCNDEKELDSTGRQFNQTLPKKTEPSYPLVIDFIQKATALRIKNNRSLDEDIVEKRDPDLSQRDQKIKQLDISFRDDAKSIIPKSIKDNYKITFTDSRIESFIDLSRIIADKCISSEYLEDLFSVFSPAPNLGTKISTPANVEVAKV